MDTHKVLIPFYVVASSQEMAERKIVNALGRILRYPYGISPDIPEDSPVAITSIQQMIDAYAVRVVCFVYLHNRGEVMVVFEEDLPNYGTN